MSYVRRYHKRLPACAYCGSIDPAIDGDPVPLYSDREAWETIGAHHATGCKWVVTRAHCAYSYDSDGANSYASVVEAN